NGTSFGNMKSKQGTTHSVICNHCCPQPTLVARPVQKRCHRQVTGPSEVRLDRSSGGCHRFGVQSRCAGRAEPWCGDLERERTPVVCNLCCPQQTLVARGGAWCRVIGELSRNRVTGITTSSPGQAESLPGACRHDSPRAVTAR